MGAQAEAICRDTSGMFLSSSPVVISGVTDVASLEVIACREALSLAKDPLLQNFVVTSNSAAARARVAAMHVKSVRSSNKW